MQAVMKGHPDCFIPKPLSHIEREFPARRPNGRPAYLDFLYVDNDHRLHIVETKIGWTKCWSSKAWITGCGPTPTSTS